MGDRQAAFLAILCDTPFSSYLGPVCWCAEAYNISTTGCLGLRPVSALMFGSVYMWSSVWSAHVHL